MQIFPRSLNKLPLILGGVGAVVPALLVGAIWYYVTPKNFQVGYAPTQPVPYSHRLHVGQMGMDCRYCHANVEVAAKAMIPPTQTCMGCHALVKTDSARLKPVRESWESGKPIEWVHIHKLPDHAYFDHSAHLAAGVGCATCHGRVDQMEVVRADQPLGMGWCLDCHRNPTPNLRPKDQVTNMEWKPEMAANWTPPEVHPPQHCSGCHR
jgi:hypothetical protein